ncbi:hypothetical protein [Clavibacter sp. MX14-G9D]|uniref:hypothetical protein n=1 Tax=Clavibacter sp. MX14-G9D TaxID=3064656 RepID=UPI00293F49CE|nr:hypothetical protein [Clavibacter sp. MX14-G9D]
MNAASSRRAVVRSGTVLTAAALSLALAGCSDIADDIADIYAITYEVSTTEAADGGLTDVAYAEASRRGRPSVVQDVGRASLAAGRDAGEGLWSAEAYVTAEDWAFVQATPVDGEALTCRIFIDGRREIATATAAPGQPVTCQVPTPPFG